MANELRYESTETLLQTAAGVVSDICSKSTVFNKDHERRYPRFSDQEVVVGKVIGRGGFGVVRNVDKIKIHGGGGSSGGSVASTGSRSSSSCLPWLCGGSAVEEDFSGKGVVGGPGHAPSKLLEELSDSDERFTREYVAARSKRKTKHGTRYVLKKVSTDVSKITYMKGCVDIALEGKFLATLNDHPNIIQLVAVSKAKPCSQGYFLIIEKMSETLGVKIKTWMDMDRQNKSVISAITGGKRKELKLYYEQIASSYDIVNALHYLHSKNIIYRDLKPDNIGFDSYNVLKIFDFGLAKELHDEDKRDDGLYRNMTNCTGAVRYMAPEVGMNRPYNLSADVYSFSMLLWFILALEPPFGLYTNKMIFERVMKKGSRPAIFKKWNDRIADILRDSWDTDISQRPSFLEISLSLKQELIDCEANVLECKGGGDATSATAPSWHGSNNGCGCEEGNDLSN